MSDQQIKKLTIQYQKAMNSIDFLNEQFAIMGVDPMKYLHERESYEKREKFDGRSTIMKKKLAALRLEILNKVSFD